MTSEVNLSYFDVLNPLIYPFEDSIGLFTTLHQVLQKQKGWILTEQNGTNLLTIQVLGPQGI